MNPTGTRTSVVMGLILGLAVVGCGDPDVIASYCNLHSYCFAGYDNADCVDEREVDQDLAVASGEACHEAFVRFHECIGDLSCSMLDEYYSDSLHCGTEYSAWQSRCTTD